VNQYCDEQSDITIINGDCMEGMKEMPDKAYPLCIVDPPYGINAPNMQMGNAPNRKGDNHYPGESTAVKLKKGRLNAGAGKLKNRALQMMPVKWDYEKPPAEYFSEIRRVSANQIIFGGNYFDLGPSRCVICWDKLQPWTNFSQWEMAWTSFDKPAALFRYSNTGGNIDEKIHPTQKPVKLYEYLLKNYAKPGDKILDTHGGSCSLAIACQIMGFSATIYEIDEDYFAAAVERYKRRIQQQKINWL
jgi:site-specific DNA-methyltransferase (adenine-specific)